MDYEFDFEPDPEVVENPAFVEELNRRLKEASLIMYGTMLPLQEYENEKLSI